MTPPKKPLFMALAAALSLLPVSGAVAASPPLGLTTHGVCTYVVDGDTLDIDVTYRVRVRLLDCWAPESRITNPVEKAKGLKAKQALTDLALGKPCVLNIPTDGAKSAADILTFGRVLGHVWVEGSEKSLAEIQVANGHANATKEMR